MSAPLETQNPPAVDLANQVENQKVCIDEYALRAMLIDQPEGVLHQTAAISRIFIERTTPDSFDTKNRL